MHIPRLSIRANTEIMPEQKKLFDPNESAFNCSSPDIHSQQMITENCMLFKKMDG